MNNIFDKLHINIVSCHNAIDRLKSRYDILRNALSSYLKVRDGKHGLFYKRKLEKEKNNYEHTFNEIFDDYIYFTKMLSQNLSSLLDLRFCDIPEFEDYNMRLYNMLIKCDSLSENVNSNYLLKVGIEDFDNEILYARNYIYKLTGAIDQFKTKYNDYIAREKLNARENNIGARRVKNIQTSMSEEIKKQVPINQ